MFFIHLLHIFKLFFTHKLTSFFLIASMHSFLFPLCPLCLFFSPRSLVVSSMLPQRGEGFIWDKVNIVEDRAVTWIFVPDSKKIFYVSISTKDVKKDNLHPTEWIEWNGVGQRDASKPIPLIESSLNRSIRPVNRSIRPEYVNQTTFESIILFPNRTDLIEFVGRDNAWSPLVGIVRCERGTEVIRGEYCRAYIVRDYDTTGSAFMVNVDTIKFLEGFKSKEDQTIFEGLDREIELAAEEEAILASKGRLSKGDMQVIPAQMRPQNDDIREFDRPAQKKVNMTRSMDGNRPRWPKKNPKIDAAEVEAKNEFVKAKRYHPVIVYKQKGDRGFVGWTPLIGSIPVYAQYTQYDDQRVEIGHTVQARVECNKRRNELAVESIMNIETVPMIDFEIRKGEKGIHLLVKCLCLDLNEFKLSDKMWNRKRVGVIEHPTLQKVLAYEEDVMKAEWKGKKVRATLQHYEGIENFNPERIRLVLETIDGLVDDDSVRAPSPIVFPVSRPDMVDSDSNGDEEEGYNAYSDDGSEVDMKRTKGKEPSTNFVQVDDRYSDRGFNSQSSFNRRGNGGDERREDGRGHSRSERGGNGRRARGGRNNQRMAPNRNSSERWSEEDNGFGTVLEQKKTPEWDRGILVCYSRRSSIFYTKSHKIIEYNGDTGFHHVRLGDCASFEFEPSNSSLIPFRVIPGSLEKISDKFFDLTRDEYRGELYIRMRARLTPHGDVFECTEVSDVSLGPSQSSLKLYNHEFVEKSRIKIGHCYDIYVKFCSEELKWTFVCIDQRSDSFEVEEEDEIEAIKRRNESNQSRNSSNRSEDDEWECVDRSEHPSRRNDSTHGPRSTRGSDHSNESGTRDPKFALPSLQPSTAPSIASCSTQMTSTTITNGKEMRNLRKENEDLRRMLKNVWNFESVQTSVKIGNYFLYETVDGWLRNHAEEESESVQ